jgi:hypothetical protein
MNDSKGNALDLKDEVLVRGTIVEFRGGLAIVELAEDSTKKYHIEGSHIELVAKAQPAVPVEEVAAPAPPLEMPAPTGETELRFREAVEYVKSKGYTEDAAENAVFEQGVNKILADKAAEVDAAIEKDEAALNAQKVPDAPVVDVPKTKPHPKSHSAR